MLRPNGAEEFLFLLFLVQQYKGLERELEEVAACGGGLYGAPWNMLSMFQKKIPWFKTKFPIICSVHHFCPSTFLFFFIFTQ